MPQKVFPVGVVQVLVLKEFGANQLPVDSPLCLVAEHILCAGQNDNQPVSGISRQWKRGAKGFVIAPPKTERGRRTIDLDVETIAVLRQWRPRQLEERVAYGGDWHESGFIFTRKDGRPHDGDVVSQSFDRIVTRAGLPPIRFHDVRHTHATLLLLAGVPPHVVSMRLGHRSIAFTLHQYAHVLPLQQAEAIERLATKLLRDR